MPSTAGPDQTPTKIMLLGTFHLEDAGRDLYKPEFAFDVNAKQAEIEEVLGQLARFQPTKIAVEIDTPQQTTLDRDYQAFLRGEFRLSGSEHHQLGFRLAARLGHPRVYAVNAWGRLYEPPVDLDRLDAESETLDVNPDADLERYAREHSQTLLLTVWREYFLELYRRVDREKVQRPLRETLAWLNTAEMLGRFHGHYLVDQFRIGVGGLYPGVDHVTAWYSRNLRIFANLQRITEPPGERLLVVYGLGHVPILRHCAEASPEYDIAEVGNYL